jgi:hypothetical protein
MPATDDIMSLFPKMVSIGGGDMNNITNPLASFGGNAADHLIKTMNINPKNDIVNSISSMAGKAAGTAIGGPIGGMIGSKVLPLVVGGVESIIGGAKKRKARGEMPGPEDNMERRRLGELDNQRRTFETGSAYSNQLKQIRNIQANTVKGLTRVSGGNTGQLLSAINNSGANAADAYGKVAAAGTERQDAYNMQYGDLLSKMASRRAALKMQQYTQDSVDAAEMKKQGNQTLMSYLGIAQNLRNNPNAIQPLTPNM